MCVSTCVFAVPHMLRAPRDLGWLLFRLFHDILVKKTLSMFIPYRHRALKSSPPGHDKGHERRMANTDKAREEIVVIRAPEFTRHRFYSPHGSDKKALPPSFRPTNCLLCRPHKHSSTSLLLRYVFSPRFRHETATLPLEKISLLEHPLVLDVRHIRGRRLKSDSIFERF